MSSSVIILALSRWTVILAAASLASANTLITYPLVPHHVQRMRRRHLLTKRDDEDGRSTIDPAAGMASIRRRASAQQVGALYQGHGTHYVDLWCGTPPQRQTVIVDTGSGVTAFPCSGCEDCGVPEFHVDALFNEQASSTFQHITCSSSSGCVAARSRCTGEECQISIAYAEGSRWDAFESVDSCYIGGPHEIATQDNGATDPLDPRHVLAFDLVFGCQTLVTGLFKTQLADGIMGMNTRREAFWSQMFAAGKMGSEKQFSLCFSQAPTFERKGTEAGALTLGGADERFDTSPMVYTTDATGGRDGFFSVRVRRMYLRDGRCGESAKSSLSNPGEGITALDIPESTLNAGGTVVDSGTTDTYWNRGISDEFNRVFELVSGRQHNDDDPISLTHDELLALPTILFQLVSSAEANTGIDAYNTTGLAGSLDPAHPNDVILAFPPSHYMEYDPETFMYSSRFSISRDSGSVLGANAIMGHNVLFDSDNNRMGWAESDCDYTKLVTENGYDFSITGHLQAPPPVSTSITPAPVSTPVTPAPVNTPDAPAPVTTPDISAPVTTPDAPAPVTTPDAPAPVTTPDISAPVTTPDAPAPVTTPDAPAPVTTPDTPAVVTTPDTPAVATTPDTPAPVTTPVIPSIITPMTPAPITDPTVAPQIPHVVPSEPPIEPMIEPLVASPTLKQVESLVASSVLQVKTSPVAESSKSITPTDERMQDSLICLQDCHTAEYQIAIFAGLIVVVCLSFWLCYRMCCRFYRFCYMRKGYKYSSAAQDDVEMASVPDEVVFPKHNDKFERRLRVTGK